MALRRQTAIGNTTPVKDLNPFSFDGVIGDDLFALRRDGTGSGKDGAMLMLNDDPSATFSFFLNSPNGWANGEVKDYSDAFMFEFSQVFADGRALYKCPPRTYAWYAPTGVYPRPLDEPASAFNLGDHVGARLHYVVLRAADVALNGVAMPLDALLPALRDLSPEGDTTLLVTLSGDVTSQRLVDLLTALRAMPTLAVSVLE